jgi:hypothetical protein
MAAREALDERTRFLVSKAIGNRAAGRPLSPGEG